MTRERSKLSLLGALGWFVGSYAVSIVGFLTLNAVAGRMLGRAEFGYFVVALTASTVLGQLGLFGVHRGGLREAANLSSDDVEALARLRGGVRAVGIVTLPLTSAVAGVGTWLISDADGSARVILSVGMGLLVWLGGQQKLIANYLRGFGDLRMASLLEGRSGGALVAACQAILLIVLAVTWPSLGLGGALVACAAGFLPALLVARIRLRRRWVAHPSSNSILTDLVMVMRRDWRFALNQLAAYLNSTVEIWIAAVLLSSVDTSLFSSAQRLCLLLALPLASVQTVFAPVCVRLIAAREVPRLERVLRTGASLAAVVTSIGWIPMLVVPGLMLSIVFGESFSAAAPVLVLLTVGSIANVVSGLAGTALTMSHKEGTVAAVQSTAAVIRVGLGVVCGLTWGLVGLAASAGLVTASMYALMWWQARRHLGLRCEPTMKPQLGLLRRIAG